VLGSHFEGRLHVRKIRVVRHDGFREHGKLHALLCELKNFFDDFADGALTAVKDGTDLYGGGFYESHGADLTEGWASTGSKLRQ